MAVFYPKCYLKSKTGLIPHFCRELREFHEEHPAFAQIRETCAERVEVFPAKDFLSNTEGQPLPHEGLVLSNGDVIFLILLQRIHFKTPNTLVIAPNEYVNSTRAI